MGAYPSQPFAKTGEHTKSITLDQTINPPAAGATMSQDIAFMVCAEFYHSGTRSDLVSVSQASVLWNIAATPWVYRSLTLDFEYSKLVLTSRLVKSLLKTDNERPAYRHYVQSLNIKMPSTEGDNSRRRLKPGLLKALARLVPMLPVLKSFTWGVSEPMPRSLLEALHNHPSLSNRAALFTCWGLNEDRQYLEYLGTAVNLSELVIDFRPRRYVIAERLSELVFYQKQLLTRLQSLKSLVIRYRYDESRPFIDQIKMEREEQLPSIERLSLERYRFSLDNREIQFHMNAQSLRSLTLISCINPHVLLATAQTKLSQLIIRGPRWNMNPWLAIPERVILQTFLCKDHGFEELELESLGISHAIIGKIVRSKGGTIRRLRIHNFRHTVLIHGTTRPVPQFRSLPAHIIFTIGSYCPDLRSLELDLTETDITGHSNAVRTLETFMSLKHLTINTQLNAPAIDPNNPYMVVVRVRSLACDVWSRFLETFRLATRSLAQDGTQLSENGSWLATRNFKDRDTDGWDVEIVDEIATAAERKLRVWAQVVNVPFDPPADAQERLQWEKGLGKKVQVAGAKALTGFK